MELEPAAAPRIDIGKLPYFNGFPYLATRLASAVYHIRLLPAEWSRDAQWDFALRQAGANGLAVCLVRDADRGEYFDPETGRPQIAGIPRAMTLPPGALAFVTTRGATAGPLQVLVREPPPEAIDTTQPPTAARGLPDGARCAHPRRNWPVGGPLLEALCVVGPLGIPARA